MVHSKDYTYFGAATFAKQMRLFDLLKTMQICYPKVNVIFIIIMILGRPEQYI